MRDIDDIRRDNLRLIELEQGSPSAAATHVSMSPAQFANLRDGARDSKTGRPRGMRKETARRIELAAGKPPGWLDVARAESGGDPPSPPSLARDKLDDAVAAMLTAYRAAGERTRAAVDLILRPPSERGALDAHVALAIAVLEESRSPRVGALIRASNIGRPDALRRERGYEGDERWAQGRVCIGA